MTHETEITTAELIEFLQSKTRHRVVNEVEIGGHEPLDSVYVGVEEGDIYCFGTVEPEEVEPILQALRDKYPTHNLMENLTSMEWEDFDEDEDYDEYY